ncbi:MAG: hypothetical protein PWP24_581 [Clostridiales bacterium]|nr:hypothetical protein [Clostridiales bacterium]
MLRHITEWLQEAAGLLMGLGIITVALLVFAAARQFGFTANQEISSVNQELKSMTYEKYDGIKLSGSEVMSAIKRYQKKLPVTIYTGESVKTYQGDFKVANNRSSSENYIKPSGVYVGSLLKNEEDIKGLIFAKEGVLLTDTSYKELLSKLVGADANSSSMEDLIAKAGGIISDKESVIQVLNQNIASLNSEIYNLENQRNALNKQVSSLYSQINSINGQLTSTKNSYNALLIDVQNGKSQIAGAVSGKGVTTAANDSFQTMANNINAIPAGVSFASGTAYSPMVGGIMGYATKHSIEVRGLSFQPNVILIYWERYGMTFYLQSYYNGIMHMANSSNVDPVCYTYSDGFDMSAYFGYDYYDTPQVQWIAFKTN